MLRQALEADNAIYLLMDKHVKSLVTLQLLCFLVTGEVQKTHLQMQCHTSTAGYLLIFFLIQEQMSKLLKLCIRNCA